MNVAIIFLLLCLNIFYLYQFKTLVIPINIISQKTIATQKLMATFQISVDKAEAFYIAGRITNICPMLLAILAKTESNFSLSAISSKGYKGIMQTPISDKDAHLDILRGAKILKEKLRIANGDLELALALYKGGRNNVAKKQARDVLYHYRNLKI